ncbi:hypothetical protein FZC78_09945 [Rossellomorea vietnamensis]|uniref:Uncharacterized protein n=1 Tax=Rossellomorea vietnamensis TaxID=218284 RepID=A0A5D4NUE2_9BACI|nr:hypothetical protein [Rossellomorea vietnamensis]TYS16946.1 hypothetical protein FZC78_09945 [Rossellomorea vietnamensis]
MNSVLNGTALASHGLGGQLFYCEQHLCYPLGPRLLLIEVGEKQDSLIGESISLIDGLISLIAAPFSLIDGLNSSIGKPLDFLSRAFSLSTIHVVSLFSSRLDFRL